MSLCIIILFSIIIKERERKEGRRKEKKGGGGRTELFHPSGNSLSHVSATMYICISIYHISSKNKNMAGAGFGFALGAGRGWKGDRKRRQACLLSHIS